MKTIIKNSPLPYYHQLKEIILEMIDNEELQPLDPIPPERELCETYGVSRMTVRTAVMSLVNEGILYREQGKGTFVSKPKPKHQLSELKGLTEEMEKLGHKVETRILKFEVIKKTKNLAKVLKMDDKEKFVIEMERLRMVDKVPYAIETVWLNQAKCFGLTKKKIEGHSLYKTLREQYKLIPYYARQTVEPIILSDYESSLLELPEGSLALLFSRTTYSTDEEIIEYTKGIYRIDQHKFEIILKA
ncbi:MAG TPA: GntR family transcriptional regulator [Bacillales bacterium]|nr:GntR family transcriptional regulator [Bacillales bacterium]